MPSSRRVRRLAAALALLSVTALSACGGSAEGGDGGGDTVTIGYQPGLGYATLLLLKQQGTLEKEFPDLEIRWQQLDSGGALRDAVISGDVQIASMGAAPFLVGVDAGVEWKTLMAMNNMNLQLMVDDPAVKSLEDLPEGAKIAMPAADSIQSVVLRKAAEEELGDAHALDDSIVAMGHPEGLQSLVSGQIDGHLTAPPYIAKEAAQGAHPIVQSYDVFGESAFNSIYSTEDFVDEQADFVDTFTQEVAEATTKLQKDPRGSAKLLAAESEGELTEQEVLTEITDPGISWTTTPTGFGTIADFMASIDMIEKAPAPEDMFFDNEYTADAS